MPCIRSSVLTASLRQNADGACLVITRTRRRALFVSDSLSRQYPSLLTRTPAWAHSQAEKYHFALSPPRGQGSGRQIYAAEKRPHAVECGYGGINRAGDGFMSAPAPRGLAYFLFFDGGLRTFRLRNGRQEVSPPRIPAPRQVYESETGRLYLILSRTHDVHTKHDSDNAAKNLGRSQPPSGKGLSEYLLQSAKGAGSRALSCKLPTRRKITPRPLPCYNTDTEGRRTYKTFDRKTAVPVFRTDEP